MNDIEERRSALEQFASLPAASPEAYQPVQVIDSTHAHGAIKVAVHRDEARVFQRLKASAAYAGTDFFYRFPVKNRRENRTDWIEGPSITLANELVRIYGNCETDVRVVDNGESWTFYARFIDLESGFSMTRPFQQRKSGGKIGGSDDDRRLDIAFQIGTSKAIRNVVVNSLQIFADYAFHEARNALVERIGKDLEGYRQRTATKLANMVALDRVEAVVGRPVKDWLAPDIARIIAMATSVADGMSSLDDTFPPLSAATNSSSTGDLDAFAKAAGADASSQSPDPRTIPGGNADAKDDVGAESDTTASLHKQAPEADLFTTIKDRMAQAGSEAACQAVWEQMDLDARFENDAKGRAEANKIMSRRLKEIRSA